MHCFLTDRIETPIGDMTLVARDGVLLLLQFQDSKDKVAREVRVRFGEAELQPASNPFGLSDIIRDYFAGNLHAIDALLTDGGGSDFEKDVWRELRKIPVGATASYGDIAKMLGDINLSRAVGIANARNPVAVVVPCHRVIGSDGTLTGYGGGIARKEWLLRHEGALLI